MQSLLLGSWFWLRLFEYYFCAFQILYEHETLSRNIKCSLCVRENVPCEMHVGDITQGLYHNHGKALLLNCAAHTCSYCNIK